MNQFSSMLLQIVTDSDLSLQVLSNNTGIERSTLYQYLNGKRKLRSKDHFARILQQLPLSMTERRELETAWDIQLNGEEAYLRKQYLEHFFMTLPAIEQTISGKQSMEYSFVPSTGILSGGTRSVIGSTAVEEALFVVLCSAEKGAPVTVMAQPASGFLERVLMNPAVYRSGIQLTLITRLSRNVKEQHSNLPILEQIMRIFSVFPDCVPLCYYSEADDSRGSILPQSIVMTERAALLIADDGAYALVTQEADLMEQLDKRLKAVRKYCVPMGRSFSAQMEEMSYLMELFQRIDFASRFELSGSFCTTPFLTEDIIRRNINPAHPQREELTAYFTRMLAYLRSMKEEKPGTIMSGVAAMTAFARTGVLQDVPQYLIPAPLSEEDRLAVLTAIHQAITEGWYHLRLFREENVILDRRWDSMCCPGLLFIELFCADGNHYFEFTEHTLVKMFMQHLQNTIETEQVTTEEETLALLEREIGRLRGEPADG